MAATSQLIYVAGIKKTIGYDDQTIDEAMKLMAFCCTKNLIIESSEDVRMQFEQVLREIKKAVGSAREEKIKVLQSLSDKIDGRPMGSNAWWAR